MELHINPTDNVLEYYKNHSFAYSGDSGLDVFFPEDIIVPAGETLLIDLQISCELRQSNDKFTIGDKTSLYINKSYFLLPRSSIYKTPLRMSNSIGLIDSSYRNNLKVPVDNISDTDYSISKGDRLFQIVEPTLKHFKLVISEKLSSTTRGSGFGSSGK